MATFIALVSRFIVSPDGSADHSARSVAFAGIATQAAADDIALARALRAHDPFAFKSASLDATAALLASHYTLRGALKRANKSVAKAQSATWDRYFRTMTSRDSISARPPVDGAYFADFDGFYTLRDWATSSH